MLRLIAFLIFAFAFLGTCGYGQSKADRKDEKRENERVNGAKDDVQNAQRELASSVKAYRVQNAEVQQADYRLYRMQLSYSQAREAAEEQLADSSGLPKAIRKMRELRDAIESLTKPILEELHKTQKWKVVSKKATTSQVIRDQLLADETRTDEELAPQLEALEKLIAEPEKLEIAATEADPKLKQLKLDYHQALDTIADLRRKIDSSKIDADPDVKSFRRSVEDFEGELNRKRKALATLNTKVASAQANVVNANKKLQQAQAADQKDSNKGNKQKNGRG